MPKILFLLSALIFAPVFTFAIYGVMTEINFSIAEKIMPESQNKEADNSIHNVEFLDVLTLDTNVADWPSKTFGMKADWGYSALVNAGGNKILFDTGQFEDTVLDNIRLFQDAKVRKLKAELESKKGQLSESEAKDFKAKIERAKEESVLDDVEVVFISHHHPDHTGGLARLIEHFRKKKNFKALSKVYVGKGFFDAEESEIEYPSSKSISEVKKERVRKVKLSLEALVAKNWVEIVEIGNEPKEIFPGVYSTGIINDSHRAQSRLKESRPGIHDEQSLVVSTEEGLVVITGCGHAGVRATLNFASRHTLPYSIKNRSHLPILGLIGGLHIYKMSNKLKDAISEQFAKLRLKFLVGSHCTGFEPVFKLRNDITGLTNRTAVIDTVGTRFRYESGAGAQILTLDLNRPFEDE